MAAPTIHSTTAPAAGLSATSASSTIVGDLVVVITIERAGAGVPTHTIQSGFTQIFSQPHDDGSTDGRLSVAYKVATAAGAQSYQAYTSSVGTETWTGLLVLDAGTFDADLIFRAAGVTTTTNAAPNPPAVGVAATAPLALNDYLFAAISFWHLGSSLTLTPTAGASYTLRTDVSGAATADVALATRAATAFSGAEDPAAYTDNQAPNGTSSVTVAFGAPLAFGKLRQSLYTDNFTSGSAAAYPQSVVAGSLLIACFGRSTNSTPTVTDSQSNTWTVARSHYDAGNDYRLDVWYAIAGSTGACSVTVTAAGGAGERTIAEYQGPFDATPLDAVNSAIGTSNSPSSGNATPSVNGALILGYIGCGTASTSFTPGTGFTADNSQAGGTNVDTLLESLVQSTAGAQDADATLSSSQLWLAIVVSFQPVSTGSDGSATGAATSSVLGAAVFAGVTASAGIGTPAAVGAAVLAASASAAGIATASAVGEDAGGPVIVEADGAAAGVGTATGVGAILFTGVWSALGQAAAAVVGAALFLGTLFSAGTATATAVGAARWDVAATAAGAAATTANAGALTLADGASAGLATAAGIGEDAASGGGDAVATGVATVTGVGAATVEATGTATSGATATGDGRALTLGTGGSVGTASATATGATLALSDAAAAATALATANGSAPTQATGSASGVAVALAVGEGIMPSSITLLRLSGEVATGAALIAAAPQSAGVHAGAVGHIHMDNETGV